MSDFDRNFKEMNEAMERSQKRIGGIVTIALVTAGVVLGSVAFAALWVIYKMFAG